MAAVAALESHLRNIIEGEVRFDVGTRAAYAADASNYRQVPVGVVIPRHEGDVIAALSVVSKADGMEAARLIPAVRAAALGTSRALRARRDPA